MDTPIRLATLADLPSLVPLADGYRVFYGKPSDRAACTAFLQERLMRADSVIFLGFQGGAAAGFAQLYPTWSTVGLRPRWTLNDLFVEPAFRRRRIGEALVEACEAHARATGAQDIQLLTEHANEAARKLYERRGWKHDTVYARYTLRFVG